MEKQQHQGTSGEGEGQSRLETEEGRSKHTAGSQRLVREEL